MRTELSFFFKNGLTSAALLLLTQCCVAQNLYDPEHSRQFADYLAKSKQFETAIPEYERVLFIAPDDSLKIAIVSCYRRAGKYTEGIKRSNEFFSNSSAMPEPLAREYAHLLLLNRSFDSTKQFIATNNNLTQGDKLLLQLNTALLNKKWKEASLLMSTADTISQPILVSYKKITDESAKLRYKSPALATGLSILIPGAGKVYTKDWKDGLISFITVVAGGWQAYVGYQKKGTSSVYGWINAGLCLGFYSGNIYGTAKAAKRYNKRLDDALHHKAEDLFLRSLD